MLSSLLFNSVFKLSTVSKLVVSNLGTGLFLGRGSEKDVIFDVDFLSRPLGDPPVAIIADSTCQVQGTVIERFIKPATKTNIDIKDFRTVQNIAC